ncbi:hypothetical protein [Pseudoruegeria sp. HB172150]|uniref:hypothetical protein n=1 Tax=Pseudoruegeria sp. HB172150 TaxID=2721164 RepID=UPI0015531E2A|nr:hypothetical protein [Pseudoruegeria sp. HB172150]
MAEKPRVERKIYDGLPPTRPFQRIAWRERREQRRKKQDEDRRKSWQSYHKLHPGKKFLLEIGLWLGCLALFVLCISFFDLRGGRRAGGLILFALLGWLLPIFRLFQWAYLVWKTRVRE